MEHDIRAQRRIKTLAETDGGDIFGAFYIQWAELAVI